MFQSNNNRKMKKFKKIIVFVLLGVALYISGYKINSDIKEIKWHNTGHTPSANGETMKKVGDYFVAEETNKEFSFYIKRDFVEANKYSKVCEEKESFMYKFATSFYIIKKQPKILKSKNDFCESDYGLTIN